MQENISDGSLKVGKLTGKGIPEPAGTLDALHYRGYVTGSKNSLACISIFPDGQIMCLFANEEGNFNLGKIKSGQYILYNGNNMVSPPGFVCGTDETSVVNNNKDIVSEVITSSPLAVPALLVKKYGYIGKAITGYTVKISTTILITPSITCLVCLIRWQPCTATKAF